MKTTGWQEARRRIAAEHEAKTGILNLGNLGLEALPPELFELTDLRLLNLGSAYVDDNYKLIRSSGPSNQIRTLPRELARLGELRRLIITSNPIVGLGPIAELPALVRLECDLTGIVDLGPLNALAALEYLDCSSTLVSELAPLGRKRALRTLRCSRTRITGLAHIIHLSGLHNLDCSSTKITDVSPVGHLSDLLNLSCSHTQISDLSSIARLSRLRHLNCSGTHVTDLAPIGNLTALETLKFSRTQVSDLSALKHLTTLRIVDCAGTRATDLTPIANLSSLQYLDCRDTGVSDLSPLARCVMLRSLDCSKTRISHLTPLSYLSSLERLSCAHTLVTDLSPAAHQSLRSLTCSGTGVTELAPLRGLNALRTLNCAATQICDFDVLAELVTLQILNLSRTPIADLTAIAGLPALTVLNCSQTSVEDLKPLANVASLVELHCEKTDVQDLTPLARLTKLSTLDISHTRVADLSPIQLATDSGWSMLRISGCRLADLPVGLIRSPELEVLIAHGTHLAGVPAEVLSQGEHDTCLERVRAHLDDLAAGTVPLRTTKIIVLGNGRVGKTQLCRRLRGLAFDERVPSTHGITIASAGFGTDETLNIWDFGGQDIYHGAHALFMGTRAVFVIAWCPELENSPTHEYEGIVFRNHPLVYWLEFVRTMGAPGSPIVVVQCRCERRDQAQNLPVDATVLNGVHAIPVAYSAKADRGRGGLNDAISEAIAVLRERDGLASIGAGRARIVAELERWRAEDEQRPHDERRHRTMTRAEFARLCESVGGVSSPEALLHYLHQCGFVFYDGGRFSERILLDQTWALDAIYAVFDRHSAWRHLQATHGRFTRKLLAATVWRDAPVKDQELFLQLMLSCGICFRYYRSEENDDEAEYIAPDLLPDASRIVEHMAGRWDEQAPTRRLVYAHEFLHPGLFRGLMADIGGKAGNTGVYWRSGLWLYAQQSRARVRIEVVMEDERRGRLTLAVQGDDPDLVEWLRMCITRQHLLYGQASLQPIVDELLPASCMREPELIDCEPARPRLPTPNPEPSFAVLPPEQFHPVSAKPQAFISYAWADGKASATALHNALKDRDVDLHLDETDIKIGDRISAFMDRLTQGDLVFIVLSEKYLQSESCMYELFGIWRRQQADPGKFLERVIPIVLPSARISQVRERHAHAKFWKQRHTDYEEMIQDDPELVGGEDFRKYKQIGDYLRHTADVLFFLNDRLIPRNIADLERDQFAPLLALVDGAILAHRSGRVHSM